MESAPNFRTHTSTSGPGLSSFAESARSAAGFSHADREVAPPNADRASRFADLFHEAPAWLLLAALVYAPWAFGSTRDWAATLLDWQLGVILGWWLVNCLIRRECPRIHPVLLVVAGWLVFQGWWMTLNAKFDFDANLHFTALEPFLASAPGTVNRSISWPSIINASLMLGAICFACELARRSEWRRRLWLVLAVTGVSLAILGLFQKVMHAQDIFWRKERILNDTFFATYRYHANAGAFLNIVWPVVAAWLVLALRKQRNLLEKILWSVALAICLAGVFANTSRASNLIALLMLAGWGAWGLCKAARGRLELVEPSHVVGIGLVSVALLVLVIGFGGLDTTWRRWGKLDQQFTTQNPRLLVAGVCVEMLPQSGGFGFGPGTFRTAFPFYNKHTGPETRGVWLFAHEDYLQTLVEWGWIGATLLGLVAFAGPGGALWLALRKRHRFMESDRILTLASLCGVAAVFVHAAGDFPLQVPSIQLYLAVLIGLLWSCGFTWATSQNQFRRGG